MFLFMVLTSPSVMLTEVWTGRCVVCVFSALFRDDLDHRVSKTSEWWLTSVTDIIFMSYTTTCGLQQPQPSRSPVKPDVIRFCDDEHWDRSVDVVQRVPCETPALCLILENSSELWCKHRVSISLFFLSLSWHTLFAVIPIHFFDWLNFKGTLR